MEEAVAMLREAVALYLGDEPPANATVLLTIADPS